MVGEVARIIAPANVLKEPLIKPHMAAHLVLRDGMQGVRCSEWLMPFARNTMQQAVRKISALAGCGKIVRSRCRAPRHRSPGYDLRRASCDHHDFAATRLMEDLIKGS
jgi:hypothetical protein